MEVVVWRSIWLRRSSHNRNPPPSSPQELTQAGDRVPQRLPLPPCLLLDPLHREQPGYDAMQHKAEGVVERHQLHKRGGKAAAVELHCVVAGGVATLRLLKASWKA